MPVCVLSVVIGRLDCAYVCAVCTIRKVGLCLFVCCLYKYKSWFVPVCVTSVVIEMLSCAYLCAVCNNRMIELYLFVCHLY